MKKIFVVNGPNLDMLGKREPQIYGKTTLADIKKICEEAAKAKGYELVFSQYNGEGEIIDELHRAYTDAAAVVLNAGAYTHYSYAIADAVKMLPCPTVELHISNVFARESFRHESVLSPYCTALIAGLGANGYAHAVTAAIELIRD
ncbi:MAG: type II 3-dehydroquinate dehydratase [Clostridiales bacterium]|nr:type II 3-dehydroquinate dehydratase [Clostridiales bacterium]